VNSHGTTQKERTFKEMEKVVRRIGGQLAINRGVQDRAVELGRKNGGAFGKHWNLLASAYLLLADRERHGSLRAMDCARIIESDPDPKVVRKTMHRIGREYRVLNRKLGVHAVTTPQQFVPRLCSDLGLPIKTQMRALAILSACPPLGSEARSPNILAAGAVYLSAKIENESRTEVEVAEKCSI